MRTNTLRLFLFLMGLVMASSALAEGVAPAAQPDLLPHTLQATNVDAAWAELDNATHPPAGPSAWRETPPTQEEKRTYYLPYVRAVIGKARDFYTKFPKDQHSSEAKILEFELILQWDATDQQSRLEALEKSLLNDPALSEDNHIEILQLVAQTGAPDKVRPLLQAIVDGSASAKMKAIAGEALQKMKALGQPVALQFTAVDGRSVDVAKLKGKVVLIDFWATWCGPCVGEVPNVKKAYDQFHDKGFEIVGISLDKDKDQLTHFITEHKMDWPQFFDGQYWQNKYARQFGIESVPTMWLLDKKGNLRDTNARENLAGGVQKLLAE